ncbi:unnamed protein product [Durusdinium trenchii]|uniref:Ubiquinol-cytochrome c chaperone domain-containing protein n=1 Tax=Durusdinium trenchii TaxID=1381693 RepID=A0ABP0KWS7_9DINO
MACAPRLLQVVPRRCNLTGAARPVTTLWQRVPHRRACASTSAERIPSVASRGKPVRWDFVKCQPVFDKYVEFNFTEEDKRRFVGERAKFSADTRLLNVPPHVQSPAEMDWRETYEALVTIARLDDHISGYFQELIYGRVEDKDLMGRFGISLLEGKTLEKPLHNTKAVPREGAYFAMLQQTYWLSLHVWLVHSKQHMIQENEGIFGSAICALITRRVFEWAWVIVRLWLKQEDVPAMSIGTELEHFMEYVFGFCAALDEAFLQEASHGSAEAVQRKDNELEEGQVGLLPCVKQVLWSNVFFGACAHDHLQLEELAVYLIRQRIALEALPRTAFFTRRMTWADFPVRE